MGKFTRRTLSIVMSLVLASALCTGFTAPALAAPSGGAPAGVSVAATPDAEFEYSVEADGVHITGYTGSSTDVVVPAQIDGVDVVSVELESLGLTSLDVSGCTALTTLDCGNNQLAFLDASSNAALMMLWCNNNKLTELDLSSNVALMVLWCNNNQLTELDLSSNAALMDVECYNNQLTSLDVSGCASMWNLDCSNNKLTGLDLSSNVALAYLYCGTNQLSELDLSGNAALAELYCSENQLLSLDLKGNAQLAKIDCSENQLRELDVSKNTSLTDLSCNDNKLTSLDISDNENLYYLCCQNNNISDTTALDNWRAQAGKVGQVQPQNNQEPQEYTVTFDYNYAGSPEADSVTVEADQDVDANMPDNPTRSGYEFIGWNTESDGTGTDFDSTTTVTDNLTVYAIWEESPATVTDFVYSIEDDGVHITGYTGSSTDVVVPAQINSVDVVNVDLSGQNLTRLDVSGNTALTNLSCMGNQLTTLNVNWCPSLTYIYCSGNQLSVLDVSGCPALSVLDCAYNQLSGLDASGNVNLTGLYCSGNELSNLNVKGCTALINLECYSNQLTVLDISGNTALQELWCWDNQLNSLNVSDNTVLSQLWCSNNQLSGLDVSSNTYLKDLDCSSNQIDRLDVSGNTVLTDLSCSNNHLSNLNVSENQALTYLDCSSNHIDGLDVSRNTALTILWCGDNQLDSLDVSSNTELMELYCYWNQLTSLDIRSNTALTKLYCYGNQLNSLDINRNAALTELWCSNNQLTSLDISENAEMTGLYCYNNQLTSLDISKNTALTNLDCYNNCISDTAALEAWLGQEGHDGQVSPQNTNVTFDYNYSGSPDSQSVACEADQALSTNMPDNPTRSGYEFKGWNTESDGTGTDFDSTTTVTDNLTVYAIWEESPATVTDFEYSIEDDGVHITGYTGSSTDVVVPKQIDDVDVVSVDLSELNLTSLDVSSCTALTHLECYVNVLSSLDVSNCIALTYLNCDDNYLTSLDVSSCTALTYLDCGYNNLTSLDVRNNASLQYLDCYSNKLPSLDISNNVNLYHLNCSDNYISDTSALDAWLDQDGHDGYVLPQNTSVQANAPKITNTDLPAATVGTVYSEALAATGDDPITWSLEEGSALPAGLGLSEDGIISGTPSADGSFSFTVVATNAGGSSTQPLSIDVAPAIVPAAAPAITTSDLSGATVGTAYSEALAATGDDPITWSLEEGSVLPAGLGLSEDGVISGTPTDAGSFSFTVVATNAGGSDSRQLSIDVAPAVVPVTGVTLSAATKTLTVGNGFTLTATVSPADATNKAVIWSSSDPLVASVNAATGAVMAVSAGDAVITATTVDGGKAAQCAVTVEPAIVAVTGVVLDVTAQGLTVGDSFTLTATVSPDDATYRSVTWSSDSPAVATVDAATGAVTAVSPGTAAITATTDEGGKTAQCTVTVTAAPEPPAAPAITTAALAGATAGTAYSQALAATGDAPIAWSLEAGSSLPAGLMLSADGVVSGTPTAAGAFSFTVVATNAGGSATKALAIEVAPGTVYVEGMSLDATAKSAVVGGTFTLKATVSPANATDTSVRWSSSNTAVATVNATTGAVKAVAPGTAVITASAAGGAAEARCTVTVSARPATAAPLVTTQPASTIYYQGQKAAALKAAAVSSDKGALTYQWYSNTTASTTGAKAIAKATSSSYTPATTKAGTVYYFCKVTNTKANTTPGSKAVNTKVASVSVAPDMNGRLVTVSLYGKPGLLIDIPGQSVKSGVQAALWSPNSGPNQRFVLTRDSSGLYRLKGVNSGLYLTVKGGKAVSGAAIVQAASSTSKAQRFRLAYAAGSGYTLVSALDPAYAVGVNATTAKAASPLALQPLKAAAANQHFSLNALKPLVASGTVVTIKNYMTGRYMDITGVSLANGAKAITWPATGGLNQRFTLTYNTATGYYTVTPLHSGKPLSIGASATFAQGTQLYQYTNKKALSQQWDIVKNANGTYTFYQPNSRFALSAMGGNKAPGTPVIIWPANNAGDQSWVLKKQ